MEEIIVQLRDALEAGHKHDGGEGYCDTGNDMNMRCRSECYELALARFDKACEKLTK